MQKESPSAIHCRMSAFIFSIHSFNPWRRVQWAKCTSAERAWLSVTSTGLISTRRASFPDPFSSGRLFKSGDLAVELPDGSFDFLGRTDNQVKVRGFRVELGEIESALTRCEGLQAAVVRAIEFEEGDRRLVAFVIGEETFLEPMEAIPATPAAPLHGSIRIRATTLFSYYPGREGRRPGSGRHASPCSSFPSRIRTMRRPILSKRGSRKFGRDSSRSTPSGSTRTSSLWVATPCWQHGCWSRSSSGSVPGSRTPYWWNIRQFVAWQLTSARVRQENGPHWSPSRPALFSRPCLSPMELEEAC